MSANKLGNFRFIAFAGLLVAMVFLASTASAATVSYRFTGVVDDLTDKKVDAADYGFSVGDIVSGYWSLDDTHPDSDGGSDRAEYLNPGIDVSFWVTTAGGVTLYSDNAVGDDIEFKIENDRGSNPKDKLEFEDKSTTRAAIDDGSTSIAFDKLKVKFEDDDNNDALSSIIPTVDPNLSIANWNKAYEFELKFKEGGDEVKLKGTITAMSVVPIPAAAWLLGSGLGLLLVFRPQSGRSSQRDSAAETLQS